MLEPVALSALVVKAHCRRSLWFDLKNNGGLRISLLAVFETLQHLQAELKA
jgi:hypothetical protein